MLELIALISVGLILFLLLYKVIQFNKINNAQNNSLNLLIQEHYKLEKDQKDLMKALVVLKQDILEIGKEL